MRKGQNNFADSSSHTPMQPQKRRKRPVWLLLGVFLVIVLLLGGVGGWLVLEQNSLLVFAGSSDSSLGAPLWHYHSDTNITHQVNWLPGGTGLVYDGLHLNLVNLTTGRSSSYPMPLSAEAPSCPAQQCEGNSDVTADGRYASEVDDAGATLAIHLRVWDLQADDQKVVDYTQAVATTLKQGPGVIWSPDVAYAAVQGGTGWLLVWHAGTGQQPFLLQGVSGIITNVSWSQNDEYVAASTDTGRLAVWNTRTRQPVLVAPVGATVTSLALSPTGTSLAIETNQQVIQIWNITTGTLQLTYRDANDNTYLGPNWSQDGKHLLSLNKDSSTQDETLRIWDTTNGQTLAAVPIAMDSGWSLSPDGRSVATEDPDKSTEHIWDTQTGHVLASHAGSLPFGALPAWSPDSRELATVRRDNAVQIWSIQTGQTIYTYQGNRESVMEISWSPDSQKLVILTTLLTFGLFDFQHTSATLHGSSITVWHAPH